MVRAFVSSVSWGGAVRHPMSAICTSPWVRRQVEIIDHICETVTRGFAICSADEMFQRILLGWQYFFATTRRKFAGVERGEEFQRVALCQSSCFGGEEGWGCLLHAELLSAGARATQQPPSGREQDAAFGFQFP